MWLPLDLTPSWPYWESTHSRVSRHADFSPLTAECQAPALDAPPHTRPAVSTTSFSLAHWLSSVIRLPSAVAANPHCGLSARFSMGTYRAASSIRFTSTSGSSICGSFELTSPSTTVLLLGMNRRGANDPERLWSYSRK